MLDTIKTRGGKGMRSLGVIFTFVLLISVFALPATAREVAGKQIPEEIHLKNGTILQLNGVGIRYKLFFKIYIAELYLEHPSSDADQVVGTEGNRRIIMDFLYDDVPKEKLVDGWNTGFQQNLSEEKFNELKPKISKFNEMFTDMKDGDQVVLDYVPEKGTEIFIRGESLGHISGKDFNDALLLIWLGKEPVSSDLREELLAVADKE
jgi:hypothetical protein